MAEHVFLCGLSKEQQAEFPSGTVLSFEKGVGNLKLKLDRMRKRLAGNEPRRLTDFVELASYVFAADRTTRRGPLTDPGVGKRWRRAFLMVVAVRDLDFWHQKHVHEALAEVLNFLSEDRWRFEFVNNEHPISLQHYLDLKLREVDIDGGTSVLLFSGGLDSLAGAVHELRTTNRHVVLVSHRNLPMVGTRQAQLAERLAADFPNRVTHVWVDNSLTMKFRREEETQRTRTFFFTAMAAIAAHIEAADRIRFYENGVMSVNLPFATQLVGARTSRSTHPRSLRLMKDVLLLVFAREIDVDNPFAWRTKVEIVGELANTTQAELIKGTTSCSRSQFASKIYQHHCGTCVQCLQRRISTIGAGAASLDEAEGYATDFLEGPRDDGLDRVMALETIRLALDCAGISESHFFTRFADSLALVLRAYPMSERDMVAKEVIDLYRRHGEAVRDILIEAVKTYASGLVDQSLPSSSLLALILRERLVSPELRAAREPSPPKLLEPDIEHLAAVEPIRIAVDQRRHAILISDRPDLRGAAIFAVMKTLTELSLAERGKPGLPANHQSKTAKAIAIATGTMDADAVRSAISRAKQSLKEAAEALGFPDSRDAIIERTSQGYRSNPDVQIVSPEQIRKRA